jgi:hypothetical protein
VVNERGGERAANAAPAPGRTHIETPQSQRVNAHVGFDGQTTNRNGCLRVEAGQQDLPGFLESFGAAFPVLLKARDVQDAFGICVSAQPGEACRQGVHHTCKAELPAQTFTR